MFRFFIFFICILSACTHQTPLASHTLSSSSASSLQGPLYFEVNDTAILDQKLIDNNARWLKEHPDRVVILEGHCDERGGDDFNLELGDKRARKVMEALMTLGVPENQLIIVSYGRNRPVISNHQAEGWSKNRRVEFVIR